MSNTKIDGQYLFSGKSSTVQSFQKDETTGKISYVASNDNKTVNVGEKRIYAPNIVAVVNGEAKILETGISTKETNPYMKLTKEMKSDSKKAFKKVFKYINK